MYTIKEVAEKMDVSEHTLRFWAKSGFFPFVKRDKNNVRMLTKEEQYQLVKEEKDIFQYMEPDMQQQYKMDNIEKLNSQELREFVLYSGKFGAIGNLDDSSRNLLHRRNKW